MFSAEWDVAAGMQAHEAPTHMPQAGTDGAVIIPSGAATEATVTAATTEATEAADGTLKALVSTHLMDSLELRFLVLGWQSGGQYASQYGGAGTATEAVQAAAWSGGYGGSGGQQGGGGGGGYAPAGGAPAGGPPAQWNSSTAGGGPRGY